MNKKLLEHIADYITFINNGEIEKFEKDNTEKTIRKQLEVDFVCNQASKR